MNKYNILALMLSPTVIALFTIVAVLKGQRNPVDWIVAILSIVLGPVLPVVVLAAMKKTDLNVSDQTQRTPLLVLAILSYFIGFVFFHIREFWAMKFVALSYGVVTAGIAAVNAFYTKGSIHMAGIMGPSTILMLLGLREGVLLLLLSPLVALIRLKVKAHDRSQIVIGGMTTVALTLLAYFVCTSPIMK